MPKKRFPFCWQDEEEDSSQPRVLHCNVREPNNHFATNYIRTTNYTILTFVPLNLIEQFSKMSNVFFLVNMVIALIPGVSPVFPATTIMPLVVVVGVAAARDAYEDFQRYQSDRRANALRVQMVTPSGHVASIESKDVHVGDVLYLERGAEVPADCLILSTALDDGASFVETASLDGETNLKPKQTRDILHRMFRTPESIANFSGTITCDPPGPSMHKWLGKIACPTIPEQSVEMDNFLLRGCIVRNVDWVMAVTVYTGVDSRLFRNLVKKPPKASRLDEKLNRLILIILGVQQSIIVLIAGLGLAFRDSSAGGAFYLQPFNDENSPGLQFVLSYLTFFILLSLMMPISLFVSLEFCKTAQAKIMEWDEEMMSKQGCTKARTSSLNEELSQVQYIFTDKTGTLTDNEMRFALCFAGNAEFDELKKSGNLRAFMENGINTKQCRDKVGNFLRLLAFCNTVVINAAPDGSLSYDGSSTDEIALVGAALGNGNRLLSRTSDSMTVDVQEHISTVEVITFLPFTPERKMMSVVLREKDGTIRMYTKGADSSVMSRLADSSEPFDIEERKNAQAFLDKCADSGLRTLACGERVFTQDEFASWKVKWDDACLCTDSDRDDKIHNIALEGENYLTFVGCTAIEDRLQDEVPETIHFLLKCGIVIWVLTGDKRETAVNIAGTSRLLNQKTDLIIHIDAASGVPVGEQIEDAKRRVAQSNVEGRKSTFIVDGRSLEGIFEDHYEAFRDLGLMVSSAVCCRVTPLQKSKVVKMFKELGNTCLGVGDGANDVSMIQEARVGIGILGLEGSQAERASDYAIPRFKHLRRLLAVHGRYSLIRNSNLIQYSFYKNIVFALTQVFFNFYTGFSGQTAYDSWVNVFFNMAFTLLPPMVMGILDFDVRSNYLLRHPGLYSELRSPFAVRMSRSSSFLWLVLSLYHAILIYYGIFRGYTILNIVDDGREGGLWGSGTLLMTVLLSVVIFQSALSFLSWTWVHALSIVLSFALYTAFIFIYSVVPPEIGIGDYYKVPSMVYSQSNFWLNVVLWIVAFAAPQVAVLVIRRSWFGIHMHRARVGDHLSKKSLPWHSIAAPDSKQATEEPLLAGMLPNPYNNSTTEAVSLRQSMSLSPQMASAASIIHNKNRSSQQPVPFSMDDDDI